MRITGILAITAGCLAASGVALAQQAISAKSGMINYIEGRVLLDGKPVEMKFANFPAVSRQSELRTEEGRAEILLGPGVFLRMGENSAFKMVSDRISDTQLEFLEGAMVIECAQFGKDESVVITYKDARVTLEKNGVYRFDDQPPRLMVYDGEAKVMLGGQAQIVRKSRTVALEGEAVAEKFDSKAGDALFRWAGRRAEYLALANVSAARSADQYGSWGSNGWIFNPYFGMYTFLPMGSAGSNGCSLDQFSYAGRLLSDRLSNTSGGPDVGRRKMGNRGSKAPKHPLACPATRCDQLRCLVPGFLL
jgi:hypothetical protein